jgi:hypothetical protein
VQQLAKDDDDDGLCWMLLLAHWPETRKPAGRDRDRVTLPACETKHADPGTDRWIDGVRSQRQVKHGPPVGGPLAWMMKRVIGFDGV